MGRRLWQAHDDRSASVVLNVDRFKARLADLEQDIYAQPEDPGHKAWGKRAINQLMPYAPEVRSVVDVGCGQGVFKAVFNGLNRHWMGVTLGPDFRVCQEAGLQVYEADMSDLPFPDDHIDLIFARHVLEHSPFPILTLMEWRRVAKCLLLVAPAPDYWGSVGRNHYSVAPEEQLLWWLARAGWTPKKKMYLRTEDDEFMDAWRQSVLDCGNTPPERPHREGFVEFRFLCERAEPRRE
jgi:SAM-dependent methyltransferase